MRFVSFYTPGYEGHAKKLAKSLKGLPQRIVPMPDQGSWERNCAMKAPFVHTELILEGGPVCWVDADAEVLSPAEAVEAAERYISPGDIAVCRVDGEVRSGTIVVNYTIQAEALLMTWRRLCVADPDLWDQWALQAAIEAVECDVRDLPTRMCFIPGKDEPKPFLGGVYSPLIRHGQASRESPKLNTVPLPLIMAPPGLVERNIGMKTPPALPDSAAPALSPESMALLPKSVPAARTYDLPEVSGTVESEKFSDIELRLERLERLLWAR